MNLKTRKQMKENKGITLIALVIIIIVLLILTGITIGALTGDNGIINKAIEAKNLTYKENLKEQIEFIILSTKMKSNNNLTDINIKEELESQLNTEYKLTGSKTAGWKLEVNDEIFIINTEGNVYNSKEGIPADGICGVIYGDYVTNYTCENSEGINGWRIFYSDGDYIYLIADNYIESEYLPNKNGITYINSEPIVTLEDRHKKILWF